MSLRENSGKKGIYLNVSGQGSLYIKSKEPREGFEKFVAKNGSVSYRKNYFNGMQGFLTRLYLKKTKFDTGEVDYVYIGLEEDDEICYITIPLLTVNRRINPYIKSFLKIFPNIDLSRKIVIQPARPKAGEEYANSNFFVKYVADNFMNEELVPYYYKRGVNGWPKMKEVKDFTGKISFDTSDEDAFAYKELEKAIEKVSALRGNNAGASNTAAQEPKQVSVPPQYQEAGQAPQQQAPASGGMPEPFGEVDDLPF